MQQFTRRYRCPKCDSGWIDTHWCSGGRDCPHEIDGEHMHRHCQKCGYEQIEGPLDMAKALYPEASPAASGMLALVQLRQN